MALVPQVRRLGLSIGLFDEPDGRKQHSIPMVRLGGIAMVVGFGSSLSIVWGMGGLVRTHPRSRSIDLSTLAGSLCFFLIGLADDLFALSPRPRLAGQIAVSTVIWTQGVQIGAIDLPWFSSATGAIAPRQVLSLLATVVWSVGVTNAINWLDGLDGLAAGAAGIAAIGLVSVSFSFIKLQRAFRRQHLLAAVWISTSQLQPRPDLHGRRRLLFPWLHPGGHQHRRPAKGLTTVSLLLPLPILFLPVADMSAVIMGRLREGRSPFYPDRRHPHHRLLRAGFSHRRTVLLIYVFTQWLASLALVVANAEMRFLWLGLATSILVATVVISRRQLQTERALEQTIPQGTVSNVDLPAQTAMAEGVEILCVGTELLLGDILNGNA